MYFFNDEGEKEKQRYNFYISLPFSNLNEDYNEAKTTSSETGFKMFAPKNIQVSVIKNYAKQKKKEKPTCAN
jgi:hypothetical protein